MDRHRIALAAAVVVGVVLLAAALTEHGARASAVEGAPEVVAHEWGTFTSVADEAGNPTEWVPLSGEHDLPCFVDYFDNREVKILGPGVDYGAFLTYKQAKSRLRGTVRMETPVIYFYADHATAVDVSVRFPNGLFSEWYPAALVAQSPPFERVLKLSPTLVSEMRWKGVRIEPGAPEAFPVERQSSHYYAARRTDAHPIRVGDEQEKFLFYRGVGAFPVPISAVAAAEESVIVKNLGADPLPGVVLFSRQRDRVSFRVFGTLDREITLTTSPARSDVGELRDYLHRTLVETGLFPREAQAMLDTWGDSWFEEGTRVFYVVPPAAIDRMLPLAIAPAPAATVRAFVGRVEVITPEMELEVAGAFARNDGATLKRYGRLIGPIGERLITKADAKSTKARISAILDDRIRAFAGAPSGC